MDSYGSSIKKWYRNTFNDGDLFFLIVVTLFSASVIGFLIKNYFVINGGSIFLVCGAAIAGVLSFLAIETSREIKEKEIERNDIERLGNTCFDLNVKLLSYKGSCAKSLVAVKDSEEINDGFTKTYEQMRKLRKEIAESREKGEDVAGRLKREESLSERGSFLNEKLKEANSLVNDCLDFADEKFSDFITVSNRATLISQSIRYNHELEDIDLDRLINHLENYTEKSIDAKDRFLKHVSSRIMNEKDDEDEKINSMADLSFPNGIEVYEEIEELYKCPGLKIGSQSQKYAIIKNRCISIALFFTVLALINGFTFR